MAYCHAQVFFLLLAASMLAVSMASRPIGSWSGSWRSGWFNHTNCPSNSSHHNTTQGPNKIVVGGSDQWHFGFNYTDWALKNGPFYLHDTLVFKYDPPSNGTPPHSVYLLPNLQSFLNCDLTRAKMVANVTEGGGDGFEFELVPKRWQPYYFACGEHNGDHCNYGMMKFFVMPLFKRFHG